MFPRKPYISLFVAVVGVLLVSVSSAFALQGGANRDPGWRVDARSYPTNLPPGGVGFVEVDLYDIGAAPSDGPVTVTDTLPEGVTYTGKQPHPASGEESSEPWACMGPSVVVCTSTEQVENGDKGVDVVDKHAIDLEVSVAKDAPASSSNFVTASGGGALSAASATETIAVSESQPEFGFTDFEAWASNPDGLLDTQAGSHPYELTVSFDLNNYHVGSEPRSESIAPAGAGARNIAVNLPPGIIGNPQAVPRCSRNTFDAEMCPTSTQIGVDDAFLGSTGLDFQNAIYNLVPPPGSPAQFGFTLAGNTTLLDAGVRSGGDYAITEHVEHILQKDVVSNQAIIWGVPSDPSHDGDRCASVNEEDSVCGLPGDGVETPFLTLPTSCEPRPGEAVPTFSIEGDAWASEALTSNESYAYSDSNGIATGLTGCLSLSMKPTIGLAPDTAAADTPAGLSVDVKVPQEGLLQNEGLSTANLKNTTVTLPEGLVINPGQAAGLQACQSYQDGLTTAAEKSEGKEDTGPAECPDPAKVGTDEITTPLLAHPLQGDVYVLQSNPPELKLLVTASGEGVNLKLVGIVHLNTTTGQLTTTFSETPELPFTDFKLSFSGGAQAALDTPTSCGTYSSDADFSPWSAPFSPDVFTGSSFAIDSGPGGSPCASPLPFGPSLIAGATTDQAGGYTDFSMLLQSPDDQQRISKLQFKAPAGLSGMIANVPLCGESQAAQGTCSSASQIGHSVVASGPGPYPLVVPQPGEPEAPIYLTGPYEGAPFGLSIVTPVIVGPFNLGTIVTRAKIEVDPRTAQITVTTDPLPQIIDGVPTDLRTVDAVIDRPEFMFNPTNCSPQAFSGSATSAQGTTAVISSHFQVGSCQSLKFGPDFKVSSSGKTSKAAGASLSVKILYPSTPPGNNQASSQANIGSVKVDLPEQLPSRLTTLQKACTAKQFDANPGGCPAESVVGHAKVLTPLLPVPVEGPAYFVSNGDEAFPNLIMVLQGYGVTIELVGDTFISKAGITSSTFKSLPDVSFSSFELTLPEGKYSALAANGNLCAVTKTVTVKRKVTIKVKGRKQTATRKLKTTEPASLTMPTAFTGENGATINQSTPITVTGCPKSKAAKPKAKGKKKK